MMPSASCDPELNTGSFEHEAAAAGLIPVNVGLAPDADRARRAAPPLHYHVRMTTAPFAALH